MLNFYIKTACERISANFDANLKIIRDFFILNLNSANFVKQFSSAGNNHLTNCQNLPNRIENKKFSQNFLGTFKMLF